MSVDGTEFPWKVLAAVAVTGAGAGLTAYYIRKPAHPNSTPTVPILAGVGTVAAWEFGWWAWRRHKRTASYNAALQYAKSVGKPLVVIGAPDSGPTSGYGCGTITVDLSKTSCPNSIQLDITKSLLPFPNDSVVVFVSCVLEYIDNYEFALHEINRVSGGHAYFVGVEPWTFTGHLFPGAKRTLPPQLR